MGGGGEVGGGGGQVGGGAGGLAGGAGAAAGWDRAGLGQGWDRVGQGALSGLPPPSAGRTPLLAGCPAPARQAGPLHRQLPPGPLCAGAKLFYLSGLRNGKYLRREVHNLGERQGGGCLWWLGEALGGGRLWKSEGRRAGSRWRQGSRRCAAGGGRAAHARPACAGSLSRAHRCALVLTHAQRPSPPVPSRSPLHQRDEVQAAELAPGAPVPGGRQVWQRGGERALPCCLRPAGLPSAALLLHLPACSPPTHNTAAPCPACPRRRSLPPRPAPPTHPAPAGAGLRTSLRPRRCGPTLGATATSRFTDTCGAPAGRRGRGCTSRGWGTTRWVCVCRFWGGGACVCVRVCACACVKVCSIGHGEGRRKGMPQRLAALGLPGGAPLPIGACCRRWWWWWCARPPAPHPPAPPPAPALQVREVAALHDPCPLPDKQKRRSLNERERLIYAPMSGVCVGGGRGRHAVCVCMCVLCVCVW